MGSSSSFTVGLLHNLYAVTNQLASKETLAAQACEVEIDLLKEPIGKQDQYAAAYGGLNVIEFLPNGHVNVEPVYISKESRTQLEENLMMFYIGNIRSASAILSEQRKNTSDEAKFKSLQQMVKLVYELRDNLISGQLDEMGRILHENWELKQQLASGITNPTINEIYQTAMQNGALGGKLLGAGGGGFMLFYCPKEKQAKLKEKLSGIRPFDFTFEQDGSKLIHYTND
jgi:D-glycero-alpha-D-manno-heptose-7-phosphate kinase